jgi:phosphoenolpyruvate synthase/pyruvate phosphate dikinase
MIHANQKGSGASVFFTRRESSEEKGMYGDTREAATGDDLVRGRFVSRPLSIQNETGAENSLERIDPELFRMHELLSGKVEQAMGGLPQEVEAAYTTRPDNKRTIYILQTKRLEFNPEERDLYEEICRLEAVRIGVGIGVNGGMLSGTATFSDSADDIREIKKKTGLPVVLLRRFSSAEDVSLMPYVDGILTAAGGATSHAAILAQKFGLTAVVCQDMKIDADAQNMPFAMIGNTEVKEGFFISIHGHSGHVYSGLCKDGRSSS